MKLALYYPWVYLTSGAERCILELVKRSRHDWVIYTTRYEPENTFSGFAELDVRELKRVPVERNATAVARAAWTISRQTLPDAGHQALLVVCEGLGDLIVFKNRRKPALCLCLTPLRAAFDPVYRARAYGERGWIGRRALDLGLSLFAAIDRRAWRHYRKVFCIAEEVIGRVAAGGLRDGRELELLHPGLGVEAKTPSTVRERFFLIGGRIMWTKNIELGIEAFRAFESLHSTRSGFRLVIAGKVDRKSEPYLAKLRKLAVGLPVEFIDSPSDGDLEALYRRCWSVLFTPFNEDWGIVPLEAMSFGKPVIAVNSGGPRETVVDGVTGMLTEPTPGAFAESMWRLVHERGLCERLGEAGPERARLFSWDRFVDRIDEAMEEACGAPALERVAVAAGGR